MRAALAVLGLLAHAVAAPRPIVDSNPVAEAVTRAVEYWDDTPCGGSVTIVSSPSSEAPPAGVNAPSPAGPVAAMWATWMTAAGANQFSVPTSTFTDCVVHINAGVWPSWQADDLDFPDFCKEMLHEYGHFEGYPDAGQAPGTIQYERPDLAHVPLCERYRLVYGHTVYAPRPPRGKAKKQHRAGPRARRRRRRVRRGHGEGS